MTDSFAYSDYDLEMADRGALALAKVIGAEIDKRVTKYALSVLTEESPDAKILMMGKMEALQELKQWMLEEDDNDEDIDPTSS